MDILEAVPGLHVRASHFAFRPRLHFRGANATQTLLMVNGAPMKDLMWGFGVFWKGLPASVIERVEIIRGPGSALFGADASSGVINVITKTAGKIEQSEAGARLGSFDTRTAWMQHGGTWNGVDFGFTAAVSDTDGHDPFIQEDAQSALDRSRGSDVSAAPGKAHYGWRNEDMRFSIAKGNWRLHADYMHHGDLETGLTGTGVLDPVTRADDSRYNIDLLYGNEAFSKDWGLGAELRFRHLDYTSRDGFQERPPGYVDGDGTTYPIGVINQLRSAESRMDFKARGLYSGFANHSIQLGVGHSWQDLYSVENRINSLTDPGQLVDVSDTPAAFVPEKTRGIRYLFLQDIWSIAEDWELTAGARYDHYSDFGDTLNPRLALVWQSTDRLSTKLMYGRAFRAPTFQELYSKASLALANPDLGPERSQTWELSLAYAASRSLRLGLNLFHFAQSDLIAATGSPSQFQNTGDHTIRGVEAEAQWQATKALRISGNYTHREQDDTQYRSVYEADREAYLRADWSFLPRWNWNLQANWIGKRPRASGDTRPALAAQTVVDTTIHYASKGPWEFAASIRNLFDADAREYLGRAIPNDLPLPGRNLYAEIRYKF